MVPKVSCFFGSEIFSFIGMEVFFHLLYDMFSLVEIMNLKICGRFYHLMCMPALRAELPALEMIHVRKRPA
jgi:hypothetical protein